MEPGGNEGEQGVRSIKMLERTGLSKKTPTPDVTLLAFS